MLSPEAIRAAGEDLQFACFVAAEKSGWWTDLRTGENLAVLPGVPPKVNVPEKLMLIVSELAEAMEGFRKGRMDEHLPNRSSLEVELADAAIRIFDLAGGVGLNLGGAVAEKLAYNAQRADHKLAHRRGEGGKKF
jgi:NTP pyrophosphatase (non-canonical NTP hydrolase)